MEDKQVVGNYSDGGTLNFVNPPEPKGPEFKGNRKQRRQQEALHKQRMAAAQRMASRGELLSVLANPGEEAGKEMTKLAYAAFKEGLITAKQARLFGCVV